MYLNHNWAHRAAQVAVGARIREIQSLCAERERERGRERERESGKDARTSMLAHKYTHARVREWLMDRRARLRAHIRTESTHTDARAWTQTKSVKTQVPPFIYAPFSPFLMFRDTDRYGNSPRHIERCSSPIPIFASPPRVGPWMDPMVSGSMDAPEV